MKKKYFLLPFLLILLISCCDEINGDKHIGLWWIEGSQYVNVKKAGDNGYFLTFTKYVGGYKITRYCEFKEGCYYLISGDNITPIFCENEKNMIDGDGKIYKKKNK